MRNLPETTTSDVILPGNQEELTRKQLPNLWALMMALAASTNPVWTKDYSGTALAAIMLLQCGGRMERDVVLELVGLCL
jgi:hypothetical protein